jgi:hypothetical protein
MTSQGNENIFEHDIRPQEAKALTSDFQSEITDADYLKLAFYQKFCGWVEYTKVTETSVLGMKQKEFEKQFTVDRFGRTMNEIGGSYLFSSCLPLISRLTTTSNLSDANIYNLWNGKITSIEFVLLDSYYAKPKASSGFRQNPYDLNIERLGDVSAYLATLSAITAKAKGGFTLKELAESFITTNIFSGARQGMMQGGMPEKQGWLDRISGAMFRKQ